MKDIDEYREIEINRFQLGVLLTGLEKEFFNCIIQNNIFCSQCKSFAVNGVSVDRIYLTKINDVRIYGRCKICNFEVIRLFEFGHEKGFSKNANKLRKSIRKLTLLQIEL
jgi:hypothetical protein